MKDGRELAVISGRGIGVRLCVFFKDSVKVASAQENGVLVSRPHAMNWLAAIMWPKVSLADNVQVPDLSQTHTPLHENTAHVSHLSLKSPCLDHFFIVSSIPT